MFILINTTHVLGSKIFLPAVFNYFKSSVAMCDYPLMDDLRFKYHYNMNKFSPYHACVNIVFEMIRYSDSILGDFLGEVCSL